MKNLIPKFISEQFEQKNYSGEFIATTMFIDISGFTAMTQTLMKNGKEGAEILTEVINRVFTPSIDAIYKNDGFISIFAGDAYTSIFPNEKTSVLNALSSAIEINKVFEKIGLQKTKFGDFQLAIKIGLSVGNVEWKIIRNKEQNSYYFRGKAINNCAYSEHNCEQGEIIFDKYILHKIENEKEIEFTKKTNDYYLLNKINKTILPIPINSEKYSLENFIPKSIIDLKTKGEFREIISCFISFAETSDFGKSISKVITLTNQFGGYFNKIDFGDKGGVMLILLGAPSGKEKLFIRACDFALAVRNLNVEGFKTRIGLTLGTVFAGFVGSGKRNEYTALGMVVNLSARFMMKADWNEIYIDRYIYSQAKDNFKINYLSEFDFKGFSEKIPVYKLIKTKERIQKYYDEGNFVGRQKELHKLEELIQPIFEKKFGGIVYVNGIAGIGKSRLVNELQKKIANSANWFYMPCDEILQKSFNPIIHFFKKYFDQSEENSSETNKSNFENKFNDLIEKTENSEIKNELIRTRSIIGSLIDLYWENSLYEKLDAKSRFENIMYAAKNLLKAESLQKPAIIELEDGHWIDPDTKKFLGILTRNVNEFPFVIISACRYNDDGTNFKFDLVEIPETEINLDYLSKEGSYALIQKTMIELNKTLSESSFVIPDQTFDLIFKKSEGNPFYIEQIILYFTENQLFDVNFNLKSEKFKIPTNINAVIIARIDRLKMELKDVIKTASVLGREFAVKILSKMLLERSISEQLEEGEKEVIWVTLTELKYIFKHALIREAVYEMQLKKELRELHKLAGEVIEELYKENLTAFYPDLANHYERSEEFEKASEYLEKAGNIAQKNYENNIASQFFTRLIQLLKGKLGILSPENEKFKEISLKLLNTYLKKGDVLQFLGKWDEAETLFKISEKMAIESDDNILISESIGRIGYIHYLRGDYSKAMEFYEKDLRICQELENQHGLSKTYSNMGSVYLFQGNFEKAMEYYQKDLEICKKIGNKAGYSRTIGNLGILYDEKGDFTKAMECFEEDLRFKKETGDKRGIAIITGSIGITHWKRGNLPKAMEYFEEQYKISKEIGDRAALTRALGNLGVLHDIGGNFRKAKEYYEMQLNISRELGDKSEIARVMGNMGIVYQNLEQLEKAVDYYTKAIQLKKKLGQKRTLIYPLSSKTGALYKLQKYDEARKINAEYRKISEEFQDQGHLLISRIMDMKISFKTILDTKNRIAKCIVPLENLLTAEQDENNIALFKYELAKMNYELNRIETGKKYKTEAVSLYQKMFEETSNIEFKNRYEELEKL